MTQIRKKHSADFKHKVALAAIKRERTMTDLSQHFGVHIFQIQKWKSHLEKEGSALFSDKHLGKSTSEKALIFLHLPKLATLNTHLRTKRHPLFIF
jgi:transposase-like protein